MSVKKMVMMMLLLAVQLAVWAQKVERVVSLTPSITDNIYQIGAKQVLVGCTSYCQQAINDGVEQVGSAVNVNIEKLFSLQPDLVLTMGLTKPQDVEAMKKLGIRVEVFETPRSFEEICEQTLKFGRLLGFESEAQAVVNEAKNSVDEIRVKVAQNKSQKVFFQIGANPIFTVLENTFMDDYIGIVKGENIAAGLKHGTMTRESVLLKNPDVLIIATMGGFGAEEQKIWNTYTEMSAVKNKKVFLIDSSTSCTPTPKNFVSALSDVFRFTNQ